MTLVSLVFFVLFGAVLVAMYIGIRRRLARTSLLAGGGIFGSVVAMMLFSLGQGNVFLQALVVGIFVGGAFSLGTLAIAMYFQGQESQQGYSEAE